MILVTTLCWWLYNSDICWIQDVGVRFINHLGDFIWMRVTDGNINRIGHQHPKLVTNINCFQHPSPFSMWLWLIQRGQLRNILRRWEWCANHKRHLQTIIDRTILDAYDYNEEVFASATMVFDDRFERQDIIPR